jgi:hypothetical protein
MPSRSPDGNRKISRREATHPDGSPPRRPDRDLVAAVTVLGHLEPKPLLWPMTHAHQPEQDEHRRRLLREKINRPDTDRPPSARKREKEHASLPT